MGAENNMCSLECVWRQKYEQLKRIHGEQKRHRDAAVRQVVEELRSALRRSLQDNDELMDDIQTLICTSERLHSKNQSLRQENEMLKEAHGYVTTTIESLVKEVELKEKHWHSLEDHWTKERRNFQLDLQRRTDQLREMKRKFKQQAQSPHKPSDSVSSPSLSQTATTVSSLGDEEPSPRHVRTRALQDSPDHTPTNPSPPRQFRQSRSEKTLLSSLSSDSKTDSNGMIVPPKPSRPSTLSQHLKGLLKTKSKKILVLQNDADDIDQDAHQKLLDITQHSSKLKASRDKMNLSRLLLNNEIETAVPNHYCVDDDTVEPSNVQDKMTQLLNQVPRHHLQLNPLLPQNAQPSTIEEQFLFSNA